MKSNFKHYLVFCLALFSALIKAEGNAPIPPFVETKTVEMVSAKATSALAEQRCSVHCALSKAAQFCKNHPVLTGVTLVALGVVAYVGYDLYKTAQEEQEDDELPAFD